MSKKISIGVALALVFAAIASTFAVTMAVSQNIYNKLISDISGRTEMYASIDDINALIRTNYYYFGSINSEKINFSLSDGYVNGLGDENSHFLTAQEYTEYMKRLSGNASGIGITTTWDAANAKLIVTSVASGSSAATKGIKENDIITKIAGERVTTSNHDNLLESLSGDTLSTVSVTCSRNGTPLEFSVTVGYSFVSVSQKTIGSIGYIRISAFYSNTQDQLKEAITAIQEAGAKAVVFDLRGTKDGTVENAVTCIDCITPICSSQDEVLARLVGRDGTSVATFPSSSNNLNLPMVILVNGDTSGPAELFACDLRDFDKALLVGTKTAGNGTSQQVFTLEDGSAVILTTSKVLPYKSDSFNETGLTPNHEVEMNDDSDILDESKDPQLQKAISILTAQ